MSPVQRSVSGPVLSFDLAQEMNAVRRDLNAESSRVARTLVKDGPLTMTLVGVSAGGAVHAHKADGPVSLQCLDGDIEVDADARVWTLDPGALLVLEPGVSHSVRSSSGGFFLLTVIAARR
ncbi:MAG TPA: hypothetical protein VF159_07630 [Gemmatimonadaceae bacterium]